MAPGVRISKARLSELLEVREELLLIDEAPSLGPNLKQSYLTRFQMFVKGSLYCAEHLLNDAFSGIHNVESLKLYITGLQQEYERGIEDLSEETTISTFQQLFSRSCVRLTAVFETLTPYDFKQLERMLSKAEEYVVLLGGRPDLVTISTLNIAGESGFLVQRETKISPLTPRLRQEFWSIRECLLRRADEDIEELELPAWYVSLEPSEQRYLEAVLQTVRSQQELEETFANYSSRLRGILGPANYREHHYKWVSIPTVQTEPFQTKDEGRRLTSSIIASREVPHTLTDVRVLHAARNLESIVNHAIEQYAAKRIDALNLEEGLVNGQEIALPVLVQTLISPALPKDRELMVDKLQGIEEFNRVLSGQESHWIKSKYPKPLRVKTAAGREVVVNIMPVLYSSNHPLNLSKIVEPTMPTEPDCQNIIAHVEQFLREYPQRADIRRLLDLYQEVLGVDIGYFQAIKYVKTATETFFDRKGRQLFLCSIEQLIFERMGAVPYGSCVSAKDRKGLEFIHTDAMALYFKAYRRWPEHGDDGKERDNFVEIFASIYVTRHHHESAGQNAPGANGIKTPNYYLPTDMQTRIKELYLELYGPMATLSCDNQLADNNELKAVLSSVSKNRKTVCQSEVQTQVGFLPNLVGRYVTQGGGGLGVSEKATYSAEDLLNIKEKLQDILNARRFWKKLTDWQLSDLSYPLTLPLALPMVFFKKNKKDSPREPSGVTKLKEVFLRITTSREAFSLQSMASLAQALTYRPESSWRHEKTEIFYKIVEELFYHVGVPVLAKKALQRLEDFHQEVMTIERQRASKGEQTDQAELTYSSQSGGSSDFTGDSETEEEDEESLAKACASLSLSDNSI
jgi:hypothetical protein